MNASPVPSPDLLLLLPLLLPPPVDFFRATDVPVELDFFLVRAPPFEPAFAVAFLAMLVSA
jgi:hypothetical protein